MTHDIETVEETFTAYNAAADLFEYEGSECLISGPAGTGKSRACLEKINYLAQAYPHSRHLIARKTLASLKGTGLVTFDEQVRPDLVGAVFKSDTARRPPQYIYPNGSVVVIGGLDKSIKIMSAEYDAIYVQEATELTEHDWESLTTRLRSGKMPYQQLIGDCNPDAPTHWLKRRVERGATVMLESRHEDNPTVTDAYLAKLDALTGVRYLRLRLGLWAAAEGMVYQDAWDRNRNIIDRFPIPRDWTRYLSIDFGYRNPFVCSWWAVDHDGRLYRYREIYRTERLVEDHCVDIALASGWYHLLPKSHPRYHKTMAANADPLPRAVICDHDAEDRATFERHLTLHTTTAKKDVSPGLQAVAARMRPAGDGKPRLVYMRDSLVERDQSLVDRKLPCCTEEEMESYIWRLTANGTRGEEPVKEADHGNDGTRYQVMHLDGGHHNVSHFPDIWK